LLEIQQWPWQKQWYYYNHYTELNRFQHEQSNNAPDVSPDELQSGSNSVDAMKHIGSGHRDPTVTSKVARHGTIITTN